MKWPDDFVNKIICGDCLEMLKKIPKKCVHLVLTSPPYNVGINYGNFKDKMSIDKYISWLCEVFSECSRCLAPGGHIIIQIANTGRQPYIPKSSYLIVALEKKWNLKLRGEIIWNKNNFTAKTAWGSWLSPNQPSIRDQTERIIIYRKDGIRTGKTDLTRSEFLAWTKDLWNITPETRRKHPAPFPEELAKRCIKLFTFIGETVLDPFVGSGTTAVVATRLKRKFIGIDINPEYCEMARRRIRNELRQLKLPF